MTKNRSTLFAALLTGGVVLLASLAVAWSGMPSAIRILVPALVALVAVLLFGRVSDKASAAVEDRALAAESEVAASVRAGSQLRHDLRGILSPALLTADRLSNSQDPIARRAAEAMISTVERAEQRLKDA